MKRPICIGAAAFLTIATLACLGGSRAVQVMQADHFVVVNADGKPAVVLGTNKFGAGQLVVYDSIGAETFAVRDGKIESRLLQRWIRDEVQAAITGSAQVDQPSSKASRTRTLPVEQPAVYGSAPVFVVRIEHAVKKSGARWNVVLAVTNLSGNHITRAAFTVREIGKRVELRSFYVTDLAPQETDWVVYRLNVTDLNSLSIQITDIE